MQVKDKMTARLLIFSIVLLILANLGFLSAIISGISFTTKQPHSYKIRLTKYIQMNNIYKKIDAFRLGRMARLPSMFKYWP